MHLFGDTSRPHLWHVHVYHEGGRVTLDWEVRNAPELRWRVLRSVEGYATGPEPPGSNGQSLVGETTDTHIADVCDHPVLYYTFFSKDQTGGWQRQIESKVRTHERLRWFHPEAEEQEASAAQVDLLHSPGPGMDPTDPILYSASHFAPLQPEDAVTWLRMEGTG
jgi:hypothetical protein